MGYPAGQDTGPSHVQGGQAEVLLTPGDFFRNNPAEQQQYFRQYGLRPTFLNMLQVLGFKKGTQARYIEHWEEPQVKETFKIGSVVTPAGGAGLSIVLAISVDDMKASPDNMGGTQYGSRPRATETFIMPDRNEYRIISKNEAVNPHQITVKPTKASVNADTNLVAGTTAYIIGPIKAEGTGQVKGLVPYYFKYTNTFAIVDDTDLVSGTIMTIKAPFAPVEGMPAYFYVKGAHDAEIRHERSKGLRAFHGTIMDNASDFADPYGKTFKFAGTEGFLPFATANGLDDAFTTIGAYTIEDLFAITGYYSDLQLPYGDIALIQGSTMKSKTTMLMKDFVSDTFVNYVGDTYMSAALAAARTNAKQYNADKLFLNFGFGGYHLDGYNMLFTAVNELNNPAPGFNLKEWQVAVPMGLFENKKDNDMVPIMGYEYRSNPSIGYDRENEIWARGGAGPDRMLAKASEYDVMEKFFRTEFATHFSHGRWYVVQRPLA
jgi:hypothetical protein